MESFRSEFFLRFFQVVNFLFDFISLRSKTETHIFTSILYNIENYVTKIITDQLVTQNLKQRNFSAFSGSQWKKIESKNEPLKRLPGHPGLARRPHPLLEVNPAPEFSPVLPVYHFTMYDFVMK